jgi:ribosomal protein S17E
METNGNKLTDKFDENKAVIKNLVKTPSKKLRNIIAGYSVRCMRKKGD